NKAAPTQAKQQSAAQKPQQAQAKPQSAPTQAKLQQAQAKPSTPSPTKAAPAPVQNKTAPVQAKPQSAPTQQAKPSNITKSKAADITPNTNKAQGIQNAPKSKYAAKPSNEKQTEASTPKTHAPKQNAAPATQIKAKNAKGLKA
ncbi:hypothetical protein HDV06_006366, partial [Boothiomyces sp. JEL0866]